MSADVPSWTTVYQILIRHDLMTAAKRRRGRKDYIRLRQKDIVGRITLPDGSEAKMVTVTTAPASCAR